MINKVIDEIMRRICKEDLTPEQFKKIEASLYLTLNKYEITLKSTDIVPIDTSWQEPLEYYLNRKRLSGKSEGTVKSYRFHLTRALATINKNISDINENDLVLYLAAYQQSRGVSNTYLNTIRVNLHSFFNFMYLKGEIKKNPMAQIEKIKSEKLIKKAYSDEDLEKIRRKCENLRDMALIEFLYATGVRVSEVVKLNRDDVMINEGEVIVYGKGAKERTVYLTPVSCLYLREYLSSRDDDNPALFVTLKKPHRRIGQRGIESCLTHIGALAGVNDCHPHRFRRTMATNLLRKGMPIEEVQLVLGHENIETTLIYTNISNDSVKAHHKKFMTA